eukprot:CAMPEP_0202946894 /NCGR_PEP_ID=MMETSP1395-20130829/10381_1 /ASSEMBLY_ACC=CAM_ASM_000871 /TAXON_ID=5961 /ORGANISM="Blepharisma japonicum, Strain Stock R1072" /LENGTH=76 /DNA_ID=CAMNT_0049647777 /DNA_START=516 /DNA_END=746 /DNA_ORIENTATION=+
MVMADVLAPIQTHILMPQSLIALAALGFTITLKAFVQLVDLHVRLAPKKNALNAITQQWSLLGLIAHAKTQMPKLT